MIIILNADQMSVENWISAIDSAFRDGPKYFMNLRTENSAPLAWFLSQFRQKNYLEIASNMNKNKIVSPEEITDLMQKVEIYNKEILPGWIRKRNERTFIGNFLHSL